MPPASKLRSRSWPTFDLPGGHDGRPATGRIGRLRLGSGDADATRAGRRGDAPAHGRRGWPVGAAPSMTAARRSRRGSRVRLWWVVLVVGAGIAGLTVANALQHAGVDCTVLEARPRLGGRLHTLDLAGSPADLGGSWLHHPSGNRLRRFAEAAGIERGLGDPMPTISTYDVATARWLPDEAMATVLAGDPGAFAGALDALRHELGPGASAAEGIEAFLASSGLTGDARRRAAQGLRASVEADAAGAAEDQSLRWLWTQEEFDDDFFWDLPRHGYVSVVDEQYV